MQSRKAVINAFVATHSVSNPSIPKKFERTEFATSLPIVYLDQNVVSDAVADKELLLYFLALKSAGKVQYVYSPAHLEEVCKIPRPEVMSEHLEVITQLTDNVSLHPGVMIRLFTEEPIYSLRRVEAALPATDAVEANKVLKDADRSIHFDKYETEEHQKTIANNKAIFDSLPEDEFRELIFRAPSFLQRDEFKHCKTHGEIQHAINTLHNALDLIGYKRERKEKTIRSSAHDVEHLIYASHAGFFITRDGRLADRARQIYSFMGVEVNIQTPQEFLSSRF